MPTIVVEVMPKAELLDPQGKAVAGALARTGRGVVSGVRVGKRFELTVDGLQVVLAVPQRDRLRAGETDRAQGVAVVERAGEGDDADAHQASTSAG